jgi:hypothetical protein
VPLRTQVLCAIKLPCSGKRLKGHPVYLYLIYNVSVICNISDVSNSPLA